MQPQANLLRHAYKLRLAVHIQRILIVISLSLLIHVSIPVEAQPYQATGFKIGEVGHNSAIVWTRLTQRAHRNPADAPMVKFESVNPSQNRNNNNIKGVIYPDGLTVADIRNAAPGVSGQVRVLYKPDHTAEWSNTDWLPVNPSRDFSRQFSIANLLSNTRYLIRVDSRFDENSPTGQSLEGQFQTAPTASDAARVVFTVSTGQAYNDLDVPYGYQIYSQMLRLNPSFFVHTGDIIYYDKLAKTPELARYHWQRTYGLPTNVEFHRQVASYFIKDDHDTWQNDCWPAMRNRKMFEFTFEQGQRIFREQVPMGDSTYRTVRWGKDLQIWMVEGRDYRTPNPAPDGPNKTIWGTAQKEWFKRTVQESDATFCVLISPTPLVGPDRTKKNDNHANAGFTHEGDELRDFISRQSNLFVVCGDRHWQYFSIHPKTGVREYSCGPASQEHAGGWKQTDYVKEYHQYLNVIGGFLAVTVDREADKPRITFSFRDVSGTVKFEDTIEAK